MENLRVLEGSEVFFRGLQHLYPRFKSGWHLYKIQNLVFWIFFALRKIPWNIECLSIVFYDISGKKRKSKEHQGLG